MTFKTILVHLSDPNRAHQLARTTLDIARVFDSRVQGCYVLPSMESMASLTPVGASAGAVVVSQRHSELIQRAHACENIFKTVMSDYDRDWSWSLIDSVYESVGKEMVQQIQSADIAIVSQNPEEADSLFVPATPERLVLNGGRPTLIIPDDHSHNAADRRRVLVTWDGSREAVRSVSDSLPLLALAEHVRVVRVVDDDSEMDSASRTRFNRWISAHGIHAKLDTCLSEGRSVSDVILDIVDADNYDLLVAGAYGDMRLTEYLLQGVTRNLLKRSPIPLFMSN